ncbi:hypothetical protein AC1031_001417 [Aphanomyces cochlioides]|nr:hypothetical protein AC1031_001417 [Aphanomyces cochlioides]
MRGAITSLWVSLAVAKLTELTFVSSAAWCRYHCGAYSLRHPADCASEACSDHQRRLASEPLDLLAAGSEGNIQLKMTRDGMAFDEFWTQFQPAAERAMDRSKVVSPRTSAFLKSSNGAAVETLPKVPRLVHIRRSFDDVECIASIQDRTQAVTLMSRSSDATVVLVHANDSQVDSVATLGCVSNVVELPPLLKLTPLARSVPPRTARESPPLEITLVAGAEMTDAIVKLNQGLLEATGIHDLARLDDDHRLVAPPLGNFETWTRVLSILTTESSIDHVTRAAQLETFGMPLSSSHRRRLDMSTASLVGVEKAQAHGILGNDIVVGVTDSGLYLDHDQFDQPGPRQYDTINSTARKVVLYHAFVDKIDQAKRGGTCGHGTHVSGILAGSSYSRGHPDVGIAPRAKIAFMELEPKMRVVRIDQTSTVLFRKAGAKFFSFSWGKSGNDYSEKAMNMDEYIFHHPETLVVIAAGNDGRIGPRTISSPGGAKNVLTVGASLNSVASTDDDVHCPSVLNPQSVAEFSSQGPTSDGRIKPDVVAPGQVIYSAKSEIPNSKIKTSDLCAMQGTSQATPVVAGFVTLLYEWLRDGWWYNGRPDASRGMKEIPAALLKALVIHSSRGLTRQLAKGSTKSSCSSVQHHARRLAYPDFSQGYGLPNMDNVAVIGDESPKVEFYPNASSAPVVKHGQVHEYAFTLQPHETFRATLVWSDPPGSVLATRMLQNDLDLSVLVDGATTPIFPLSNGTAADSRNNVEMVQVSYAVAQATAPHLADNEPLRLRVRVAGTAVLVRGRQPYALVLSANEEMSVSSRVSPPLGFTAAIPARTHNLLYFIDLIVLILLNY